MSHEALEVRPWDRRRGESSICYSVFKHYLAMDESRSLVRLAVETHRSRQLITEWSGKYDWQARAVEYDSHMEGVELAQRERIREEFASKWERRRLEQSEANYDIACGLYMKAVEMLKFPLAQTTIEEAYPDGRAKITIIEPAKWDFKTLAVFAKVAADLAQIALINATGPAINDGFDVSKATPDELRAFLAERGVKALPPPTEVKP